RCVDDAAWQASLRVGRAGCVRGGLTRAAALPNGTRVGPGARAPASATRGPECRASRRGFEPSEPADPWISLGAVPETRPRVVVVGAGFAGLRAVRRLASEPVDVVLV